MLSTFLTEYRAFNYGLIDNIFILACNIHIVVDLISSCVISYFGAHSFTPTQVIQNEGGGGGGGGGGYSV